MSVPVTPIIMAGAAIVDVIGQLLKTMDRLSENPATSEEDRKTIRALMNAAKGRVDDAIDSLDQTIARKMNQEREGGENS